ncbi:MAG TPA: sugar phosphate isomerase/epimerase [Cytophagaceae bacterium]|jgi:sugar phosphate isomerase/epimerase
MKVKFFCPRWGCENLSWDNFLVNVKNEGYDGIEYGIANETTKDELEKTWEKIDEHQLEVIPQHYGTYDADFNKHYDRYAAWLELVKPFPAAKIDSQTGKDFFSFEQNKQLIDLAVKHTEDCGVDVYHETHRNKFPFAAHITKEYLARIPYLKITLDASHWVNVAESFLEDQSEAMDLAIQRTEHIHARVGYPEGPQVPDPRAPEWKDALNAHIKWWDRIVNRKKIEDPDSVITITPEFGPYPYMVHLPYVESPIASQWEINKFMKDILKERYNSLSILPN